MLKSTRYYSYFIVFITCLEIFFAVPLLVDYLLTVKSFEMIPYISPILHLLGSIYVSMGYTEIKIRNFHLIGMFSVVTNFLFPIAFISHLILAIMGLAKIRKIYIGIKNKEALKKQEELLKHEYEIRRKIEEQRNDFSSNNDEAEDYYF